MYAVYCDQHDAEVLLGVESITGIAHTEHGLVVLLECYCGAELEVRTGRVRDVGAANARAS